MSRFSMAVGGVLGVVVLLPQAGCTAKYKDLLAERDNQIQALKSEKAALEGDVEKLRGNEEVLQRQVVAERDRAAGLQAQAARAGEDARRKGAAGAPRDELGEVERALGGDVGVQRRKDGIALVLPESVTFSSGSADLTRPGQERIRRIARLLNSSYRGRTVSVDGHTDSQPVRRSRFGSNWRLSAERALAVAHYLEKTCGVDPKRLRVVGHGQYQPVASNRDSSGMQANRRVEVVILN